MKVAYVVGAAMLVIHGMAPGACPTPRSFGGALVYEFEDGSIGMRTELEVNPDGTAASYTVGDHGFTYIANGLSLWDGRTASSCTPREAECRRKFLEAEKNDFGPGTQMFCVFAMEVEAFQREALTDCGRGRRVIGNGKGRPQIGATLQAVTGEPIAAYASTTALMHKVGAKHVYIDSAQVPSLVSLTSRLSDRGHVAWVRSMESDKDVFAVVGDLGNKFGEGSIALHQLLRYDALKAQKPGPIARAGRCQPSELNVKAPYASIPDISQDHCEKGRSPAGDTDIRAYTGIRSVDSIVLSKAAFGVTANKVDEELTTQTIAAKAAAAGYTAEKLKEMAACIH